MRHRFRPTLPVVLLVLASVAFSQGEDRQPVYVGSTVCAECHEGSGMGHQYSSWLLSRHSRAYADLATPEARAMAELSGVPGEPQEAMACLGCHATAADAEAWEKDPTFRIEDGVQCERCHGPGSEYIAEEVMRDREAAMRAGMRFLTARECLLCHYEKGSHVAVHQRPQLDMEQARQTIAHPTPEDPVPAGIPQPVSAGATTTSGPSYVGVQNCTGCHRGPEMGYQFSRWKLSGHARAYAVLAGPRAREIAQGEGLKVEPQRAPACLRCHVTGYDEATGHLETYTPADGVGCESCHGAGSDYFAEAVMRDPRAAAAAGLLPVTRETCAPCHDTAHGQPFDFDEASAEIAHPTRQSGKAEAPRYKTPVNLALSPDGGELYVACEASNSVIVVDVRERRKVAEITVGGQPHDVAFGPEGKKAYVSTRLDDSVSVIDVATRRVVETFPVGDEPHGLLTDPSGRHLYVANTAADSISVIDTETYDEVKRLSASRNPWSLALSPDGTRLLVTNNLSRFVEFREPLMSEVSVIDVELAQIDDRLVVPQTNLIQGVSWHPSGEFAFVTMNRTKNLVPMTRIVQGWRTAAWRS